MGRAHYEKGAPYDQAEECYRQMREADPCRMEGLEWYSTLLFLMRKSTELSFLAQHATGPEGGRLSPQAWCVDYLRISAAAADSIRNSLLLTP